MLTVKSFDEGIATLILYFTTAWLGNPQGFLWQISFRKVKPALTVPSYSKWPTTTDRISCTVLLFFCFEIELQRKV